MLEATSLTEACGFLSIVAFVIISIWTKCRKVPNKKEKAFHCGLARIIHALQSLIAWAVLVQGLFIISVGLYSRLSDNMEDVMPKGLDAAVKSVIVTALTIWYLQAKPLIKLCASEEKAETESLQEKS